MSRVLALAALLALGACAEPIDSDSIDEIEAPATPPVSEEDPGAAEGVAAPGEADAEGNVPTLAEVQVALAQCVRERDVMDVKCEPNEEDGTEFTCTYSLDGDTPETEREAMIARDGETYVLIDIPEDCNPQ